MEIVGGFESTYLPLADVDCVETSGHDQRWREDLRSLRDCGVRRLRYPIRWHRVQPGRGSFDWGHTDEVMAWMADLGLQPIVDLVHHTSYPRWLTGGFADPDFPRAYLEYVEQFARRYPQVREYTLFNEPFATLFLAGHEALWPPYGSGMAGFTRLLRPILPAIAEASRLAVQLWPGARHVYVDTCERHTGTPGAPAQHAATANDRRFVVLDLFLGRNLDPATRPFLASIVEAGGADLLTMEPGRIDVLGLDYYAHSEWHYDEDGGHVPSPVPGGLAVLAREYADRYRMPLMLSETNVRGFPSDRASWLRYTLEQCEIAQADGVPLEGYCWFPFVDSCDWDSLLARTGGRPDPVGVLPNAGSLASGRDPGAGTTMLAAYRAAGAGGRAADLPAYRFQEPLNERLAGFLPQMAHWPWQDPPAVELVHPRVVNDAPQLLEESA